MSPTGFARVNCEQDSVVTQCLLGGAPGWPTMATQRNPHDDVPDPRPELRKPNRRRASAHWMGSARRAGAESPAVGDRDRLASRGTHDADLQAPAVPADRTVAGTQTSRRG